MPDDKPTNEIDPAGKEADPKIEEKSEGTSELDRAEAINKEKARLQEEDKKLIERKEKLTAVQMVGGHTVAGQVGAKTVSPEDSKVNNAKEFFEGTALGDAIEKTNDNNKSN